MNSEHTGKPGSVQGVYGISVAADLVGMGQPALRLYESKGLVHPQRTSGGTRRYSEVDLDRLRHIGELIAAGLNLAGVEMVLRLEAENARLNRDLIRSRPPRPPAAAPAVPRSRSGAR